MNHYTIDNNKESREILNITLIKQNISN